MYILELGKKKLITLIQTRYGQTDFNATVDGHQVSFGAFLDYIVDYGERKGLIELNPHWKRYIFQHILLKTTGQTTVR